MSHITLHPKLGVNPRLTFCPRCGGDARELMLIGANDSVYQCRVCHLTHYGRPDKGRDCVNEKCHGQFEFVRKLDDHEKLPGGLCEKCEAEDNTFKAIVAEGGIYWQCEKDKRHRGVLRATAELSGKVRTKLGVAAPQPCGIAFTGDECPACHPEVIGP